MKKYRIHPAIGVARLGDSDETFIGPEIPGVAAAPPNGNFKSGGEIKRQAARFRIFEYDDANPGADPVEVTLAQANVASIKWTVKLGNRKAAHDKAPTGVGKRNPGIPESDLVILSERDFDTPNEHKAFDDGQFRGQQVFLGDAHMEAGGQLVVAGGKGKSDFVLQEGETGGYHSNGIGLDFDNNPFWYDDSSDGPVTATIQFADGTPSVDAEPAWFIAGPPDFAPGIRAIVTLYDLMYDIAIRNLDFDLSIFAGGAFTADYKPSFLQEIYPILRRAVLHRWVISAARDHDSTDLAKYEGLSDPDENRDMREDIFFELRDPVDPLNTGKMPKLEGDDHPQMNPRGLTLTRTQYAMMKKWSEDKFEGGWPPPAPETKITPLGLDRAALENCTGGSWYPGIETNRIVVLQQDIYAIDPTGQHIRLKAESADRPPGYLTAANAIPWQADFLKCRNGWWPSQRPDDVFPENSNASTPVKWTRNKVQTFPPADSHKDMVERWAELGFVVQVGSQFREKERNP